MQVVVTAVGPDHKGLADPIVHHVTGAGANISEIQMFDHQQQAVFAMMLRSQKVLKCAGGDMTNRRPEMYMGFSRGYHL